MSQPGQDQPPRGSERPDEPADRPQPVSPAPQPPQNDPRGGSPDTPPGPPTQPPLVPPYARPAQPFGSGGPPAPTGPAGPAGTAGPAPRPSLGAGRQPYPGQVHPPYQPGGPTLGMPQAPPRPPGPTVGMPPPPRRPSYGAPPAGPAYPTRQQGQYSGPNQPPTQQISQPAAWPAPVGRPTAPTAHRRTGVLLGAAIAAAVVVVLGAALLGGLAGAFIVHRSEQASGSVLPPLDSTVVDRAPTSIAAIAKRTLPSVVTLQATHGSTGDTGSGFVMRSDGYIVTNNHVVALAAASGSVVVELADGKKLPATIVGRDTSSDLAVVKVKEKGMPILRFGDSTKIAVGDPVIAVGAPLGLQSTVTSGIVSALNRPVSTADDTKAETRSYIDAIQTDAAINPGNSGGPLLNSIGEVIGVNSAIARVPTDGLSQDSQSGSIGVGFAIPSDQVRRTAEQLIKTGKAEHPVIGVLLDTSYTGTGARVSLPTKSDPHPVVVGGPGAKAGLKPGDIIVGIDGIAITASDDLIVQIRSHAVGETVTLRVRHARTTRTVKLTLQGSDD